MTPSLATKWRYEQQEAWEREQLRLAAARGPLPKNDPALFQKVKIRCLKPFYLGGKALERGEVVTVEAYVARDMIALKKAEYVR
jgi:hypothetical protein